MLRCVIRIEIRQKYATNRQANLLNGGRSAYHLYFLPGCRTAVANRDDANDGRAQKSRQVGAPPFLYGHHPDFRQTAAIAVEQDAIVNGQVLAIEVAIEAVIESELGFEIEFEFESEFDFEFAFESASVRSMLIDFALRQLRRLYRNLNLK